MYLSAVTLYDENCNHFSMAFVCLFVCFFLTLLIFNEFYAPCKRTQHCWPTTPNILGCYMLRPVCTPCCMLLRVVGKCCAKFKTGQTLNHVQTDATTPNIVGRRVGSCFVRSQVALNYTDRAKLDRYLRTRAGDSWLKTLKVCALFTESSNTESKSASVLHMYLVYLNLIRVLTYVFS